MTRRLAPGLAGLLLPLLGCSSAHADRIVLEQAPTERRPAPASPYEVEILGEDARPLPTFQKSRRFYVLGNIGERYSIRVTNPTDRRVEALISVDGLDAIDGEAANFTRKRGYVVPARGELVVPGWRVSMGEVAAFRFASVAGSYAGRKGQPRNVGVIGVAIFEEQAPPEIILREERRRRPVGRSAEAERTGRSTARRAPSAEPAPSPGAGSADAAPATRAPARSRIDRDERWGGESQDRPGLGTEFGERRAAPITFTRFVRRTPSRPNAMAVLRYNDRAGLRALGIRLEPAPDRQELLTRETADPFPGRFAEPPR